jgi:phospholipid/cholesterol/gamma-HCH transport system substrate-binding protein
MIRRPGWKNLSVGLFSLAGIIVIALLILVYGRVGRLRGKTITLYATTDAARGVISGTEVWLDGQKVGLVKSVSFQPPSVDPKQRLVLSLDVLDRARANLRLDAKVDIRAGMSLIGDQVVYLTSGTPRARQVANGDTIHAGAQPDLEQATSDVAIASREFPAIIENVKLLADQLQTAQGTLGAFGTDMRTPEMLSVRVRSTRLMSRIMDGKGTVALAMSDSSALRQRAALAMAQTDSIRALLASNATSLGRFKRDSTLMLEMQRVRTELARVQQLASTPTGTVGRVRTDSAVVRNVHRDMASLDSLFADVKKHPFRYLVF